MNNKILIVFEETNQFKKDQISELVNLSRKECVITTIDELSKNKNIKDFCSVVDCTFDNKIFNKNKEKGTILKTDNIVYLILKENNKIVCAGPNLSQLTICNSNNISVQEKFQESYSKYNKIIDFLISKNQFLRNKDSFDKSTIDGLVLNDVIKTNQYKIYKLVYSIPEVKEPNVEYITFENIEILNELKNIIEEMTFI
jgi:hypothetical protein